MSLPKTDKGPNHKPITTRLEAELSRSWKEVADSKCHDEGGHVVAAVDL